MILVIVLVTACAGRSDSTSSPLASVSPPPGAGAVTVVGLDHVAADAVHPDVLAVALADAGFVGGSERIATGGDGAFTRVVTRRLVFADASGATDHVDWIEANAATEFFAVERLTDGASGDVLLLRHVPDGCCPREVRIYLAAWTEGRDVITVKAQGPRATDRAMVNVVDGIRNADERS